MDYTLIALLGVVVLALVVSHRYHSRTRSGRTGYRYHVIGVAVLGLWLTVAGAIGWDLSHVRGFFQATKWIGGPVWWQLGVRSALLAWAVFLAHTVPQVRRAVR
jgi:hypothetical protein